MRIMEDAEHGTLRYSPLQLVKRRLYAMRNGIVADSLRKAGCPFRLIYGVNLPQLTEIANEFGHSEELAEQLWSDESLRESSILAPMIFPAERLTYERALALCHSVRWQEESDILCFKLLKKTQFAPRLAEELCGEAEPLARYTGLRLWLNIAGANPVEARVAAERELARPDALAGLAGLLVEATSENI